MSVEIGVVPTLEIMEGVWLTLEGVKISSAEFGDVSISDLLGYACQHGRDLCAYFPRGESFLCNALCLRVCPLGEDDGVDELTAAIIVVRDSLVVSTRSVWKSGENADVSSVKVLDNGALDCTKCPVVIETFVVVSVKLLVISCDVT